MESKPYRAHPSAFVDGEGTADSGVDPNIGAGTSIWHGAHVMAGARIGEDCIVGQNVFIGGTAQIGRGCKIQNNVNIYDGVILEDFVFCGPSMTFTNLSSPLPRSAIARRGAYQVTRVRRHASIGANAVVVCGHELGEACFVAAGATVISDVAAYALVAGNPARRIGWVCECGGRLNFDGAHAACEASYEIDGVAHACGRRYEQHGEAVTKVHDPHEGR